MYTIAIALAGFIIMLYILMPTYIYMKRKQLRLEKHNSPLTLLIKGSTTSVAVIYCFIGLLEAKNMAPSELPVWFETNWWILAGLIICMIADVVLGIHFLAGMGVFFLGHICYVIYFLSIGTFCYLSIPICVVLTVIMICYFKNHQKKLGRKAIAFFLYGTFILITFSIGIFLPFTTGQNGVLPAMAAVMIVISDYMLAYLIAVKMTPLADAVSLGFYWSGQFLMAMSVFLPVFLKLQ